MSNGSIGSMVEKDGKGKVAFLVQSLILVIVILTAIVNLSLGNGDERVWLVLLGTALGVALPNPSLKSSWVPRAV